jgi:hypothetical protein
MISSPRAAHASPYKPAPPSVAWRGRFDRSTKYFLPIHADTGFVDGYSVRRIWQIEAIISGAPEYRLIRALSNESDAFGGPAAIPITPDLISAHPIKSILMIGERRAGKDKREATIRVWDVRDHAIAIIASAESDPRQCSIAACIRKPSHDGRSHLTVMAIFFEITGGLNR